MGSLALQIALFESDNNTQHEWALGVPKDEEHKEFAARLHSEIENMRSQLSVNPELNLPSLLYNLFTDLVQDEPMMED